MVFVLSFLIRRIWQGILVVLLSSLIIFTLLRVVPGDPVRIMLGPAVSSDIVEERAMELGLRDPIIVQYTRYISGVVQGDFGQSFFLNESGSVSVTQTSGDATGRADVGMVIWKSVYYSVQLALAALILTALIGIPLGIAAGLKPGTWIDYFAFGISSVLISLPNFWIALVLIYLISSKAQLLPSIGYQGISYVILPAIVLAIELVPIIIRSVSVSVAASLREGYVAGGRLRGLPWNAIVRQHILRNSAIPLLNLFGVQVGGLLLGGLFVTEFIFDYPGIGKLAVQSVLQRDFPVIQGVAIIAAAVLVVINILVDLASTHLDRRLKY